MKGKNFHKVTKLKIVNSKMQRTQCNEKKKTNDKKKKISHKNAFFYYYNNVIKLTIIENYILIFHRSYYIF